MSSEGMEGQRLVFLYPFAIDNTVSKLSDLVRDFFTVSFINEIKIDNVLNVISTANQNVGSIGSGSNQINPAELIYQVTHQQRPRDTPVTKPESDPYFYKEKLDRINDFLQQQLKHDPRFKQFRPIFSTITINELLDIPLIVGTKQYVVSNTYLYMLMMVSILYNITWRNEADISRANAILKNLGPGSIAKLMISPDNRHDFEIEAQLKRSSDRKLLNHKDYSTKISSRIDAFIKNQSQMNEIFFNLIFNRSKWEANSPGTNSMANMTFNSIHIDTTRTQKRHYEKSINSLSNYISEYIVPALHSLDIFAGPSDPRINVPEKINSFVTELLDDLSDKFLQLSNNINNGLIHINSESLQASLNITSNNIQQMKSLCEDNVNLGIQANKILQDFSNKSRIRIDFDMTQLMSFVKTITTVGNQCNSMSATVDSWLKFLSQMAAAEGGGNQLNQVILQIQSKVDSHLQQLLHSEYPPGTGYGPWIRPQVHYDTFKDEFANFVSVSGLDEDAPMTEIRQHANYFRQYVADIETALREIIIFLIKWVFFSYSCEYLKDVEVDVEIQKRDALEFPNFCLVLPYNLFKDLYITQVNRNFRDYLTSSEIEPDTYNSRDLNLNFNDIKGMIEIVTKRIQIPNLIVIDERSKKCHYKFMYMTKPTSVNFATMEAFIRHQKDVLPGF